MKIDDSFSPTIATIAMPKGTNFLTDISKGVNDYYTQKDLDEKNTMFMQKARDEMSDRKTQADYLNSGKSYADYIKDGGSMFKTPEAIESTTKFAQSNSLFDATFQKAQNELEDDKTFGAVYTPKEVKDKGFTFNSSAPIISAATLDDNKQKLGIETQKTILGAARFEEDKRHNYATEGIGATNAQTGQVNANTNQVNAKLRAVEIDAKLKNKDNPKVLTPAQKLANINAQKKLAEQDTETITKLAKDYYDKFDVDFTDLPEEQQKYVLDNYTKTGGFLAIKNTHPGYFGSILGDSYVPEYTQNIKKQKLIEAIQKKKLESKGWE